jgi:hypothetical protein
MRVLPLLTILCNDTKQWVLLPLLLLHGVSTR